MRCDYEQQPSVRFLNNNITHRFEGVPKTEVLGKKNDRSFHDLGCRVPLLAGGAVSSITRANNDKGKGLMAAGFSFSLAPSLETPSIKRIYYKSLIYYTPEYLPPSNSLSILQHGSVKHARDHNTYSTRRCQRCHVIQEMISMILCYEKNCYPGEIERRRPARLLAQPAHLPAHIHCTLCPTLCISLCTFRRGTSCLLPQHPRQRRRDWAI